MFQSVPDPIFMDICGNKFCRILCHIRTISHGNPMCHKFKHFHIIILIAEGDTFFGGYAEKIHQISERASFVAPGNDEVDPNVSGSDNFDFG